MSNINQQNLLNKRIYSYIIGFFISFFFTVIPFCIAMKKKYFKLNFLIFIFLICAVFQIFIHLKYFLHLNFSKKYTWIIVSLIFSLIVIFIIIFGSIWIMWNLNHHLMS
ncbi:Cytochrome bo(3) ubiquinol oxidase subunit 4 [Buchnera aphidicola (Symydobius americanus)]